MIGFLGGTFDPVHRGHLHAARVARERLEITTVRLVLAAEPAHRETPEASPEDRWAMLELAVAEEPGLIADGRELGGPSYTVHTLADARTEFGAEEPFVWLLGWDALRGLPQWREWRRLPELAHLAVFRRPGTDEDLPRAVQQLLAERRATSAAALREEPAGRVFVIEADMLDVSATRIRAMVRQGEDASGLLTPAVWTYINHRQLYRGPAP